MIITLPGIPSGKYTLTATTDSQSTITVEVESVEFKALKDTAYMLSITLEDTYTFKGWYVGETELTKQKDYEISSLTTDGIKPVIEYLGMVQSLLSVELGTGKYTLQLAGSDTILKEVGAENTFYAGRSDKQYAWMCQRRRGYRGAGGSRYGNGYRRLQTERFGIVKKCI